MDRRQFILALFILAAGCGEQTTTRPVIVEKSSSTAQSAVGTRYEPATFRADIARLIAAKNYRAAVALVKAADVERQLLADGHGYIAVAGIAMFLPGVDLPVDPYRDWCMPGTSDVIEDGKWEVPQRASQNATTNDDGMNVLNNLSQ